MNSLNLPFFILSFAFIYLLTIYAFLKIAELQKLSQNITNTSAEDSNQIEIP